MAAVVQSRCQGVRCERGAAKTLVAEPGAPQPSLVAADRHQTPSLDWGCLLCLSALGEGACLFGLELRAPEGGARKRAGGDPVPAARMAAGAGLARFWLYHALEQGRPGVLKVSAAELAALKRLWQLKAAFDLPPLMRAVLQEGAFQEHEGGKQSLTVKCGQGG